MAEHKSKTIKNMEKRLEENETDPARRKALESAIKFKTSWIELGEALNAVWNGKLFKEWGYSSIETYAAKEIGIRGETAMKLLRSYSFLETKEPAYLKERQAGDMRPLGVPGYEAVDVLRRANGKKALSDEDYSKIREDILEKGKDAREAAKELKVVIHKRKGLEPGEEDDRKRLAVLKRMVSILKSLETEIKASKLLSAELVNETEKLIKKLEKEVGNAV